MALPSARRISQQFQKCACLLFFVAVVVVLRSNISSNIHPRHCSCGGSDAAIRIHSSCDDKDAAIKERLRYRRSRIREACATYGYASVEYAWLGDVHVGNVIWRKIPKVASTYLAALLLRKIFKNSTFNCDISECHDLLDKVIASDRKMHDNFIRDVPAGEGGSLLVVRRPYDRLVSAFMDKIAESDKMRLWGDIKRISGNANTTSAPTFSDFVNFLIWHEENNEMMDGHWAQQEMLSRVCTCDFQYIVQMETMDEEMPYVTRMLGLQEEARHPIGKRNIRRQQYNTSEVIKQLNETQLEKLDSIYRMDIILFSG